MKPTLSVRLFIMVIIIAVLPVMIYAQNTDQVAIKQLLKKQINGWNKGSIEEYMVGYWQSDSLLFIGKNGPRYGYEAALENYKRSYPDTATMGKLTFDLLQLKSLSPYYYSVVGKWSLKRTKGDVSGYFTLLLRKIKNNWLIIADHSS